MNTWKLEEQNPEQRELRKQESLFAQGNGYLGWRGTFEEDVDDDSLEGVYINGFYESYPISYPETAYGYPEQGQTMLNLMNAKIIRVLADGETVRMQAGQIRDYHRELDFKTGVLTRSFIYSTKSGKELAVTASRLISFANKHRAAIQYRITPLNFSGDITLLSALNTDVGNLSADKDPRVGTHLPAHCFEMRERSGNGDGFYACQRTLRTRLDIACAAVHRLSRETNGIYAEQGGRQEICFQLENLTAGETVTLEKFIACSASERPEQGDQPAIARREAELARKTGFDRMLEENRTYLQEHWRRADIEIQGDDLLQQGLRFNSFHILQSVGKDGLRNVAAKGLTGEGYEGHYFWDTEMYVIPSLLYSSPDICRRLLEFRYSRLDDARNRAREMGHKTGALYPWRTIGGTECSTFFPAGTAQYHINGDIALAVKNYVQSSGDTEFLEEAGAEMLFETARLWADLGAYSPTKGGKFCINCVTGPDEYTAVVNNNFYTNMVARENLWYAYEVCSWLAEERPGVSEALCRKVALKPEEAAGWKRAADHMYFPYDEERGIFLQDDSFADKPVWDFAGTPPEQHPLLLHFHPLVIYRHQVLKQADTVLADFMLDQYIDPQQIKRDFDFYEPLTTHDSSLSACIHSIAASRIGYADKAYEYFLRSARTDLDDHKGNTKDGVHIANMAGTAMCILNGFAGLRQWDGVLQLRPTLPEKWSHYTFRITFRHNLIQVTVDKEAVSLVLLEGNGLTLKCWDREIRLSDNHAVRLPIQETITAFNK